MVVLGFKAYRAQGQALARALSVPYEEVAIHHFPDGESKVTLPPVPAGEVVLCLSLDRPNPKLVELHLTCAGLREMGQERITLVAPYLCYMRQDRAFHPGEVVSQRVIGRWLGELVDRLITVDPHLHRVHHLSEAIPGAEAVALTAAPLIADFLKRRPVPPLLLGPDEESAQWVGRIGELAGLEWAVARKRRHSDRRVSIELPEGLEVKGRRVVIVDDVASTGRTVATTAKLLKRAGAELVKCCVTHPLFSDDAEQTLTNACITHIWSTDSIPHHSNVIALAPLLAEAVRRDQQTPD